MGAEARNVNNSKAWLVVGLLLALFVVLAVLLVVFVGTPDPHDSLVPAFSNFTAQGVPWCQTRYQASFANGAWSRPSDWTPVAPEITEPPELNVNPLIVVDNAKFQQVVSFRRQVLGSDVWHPVDLRRVSGIAFVDTQHPCTERPPPLVPDHRGWILEEPQWCTAYYSVSAANGGAWSGWSSPVASATQKFPILFVDNAFQRNLVFRRSLDLKTDPVGEIVSLQPVAGEDSVFVDYDTPCAAVHVTDQDNVFRVCVDEGAEDQRTLEFHVPVGEYPLRNLLAVVAEQLSARLGLTTALYDSETRSVRVQGHVPQPGPSAFSGLTYRVRTAVSGPSPNADDGPSLNLLLGFTPEAAPESCVAGSACEQVSPSPPVLTFAPASELWGL